MPPVWLIVLQGLLPNYKLCQEAKKNKKKPIQIKWFQITFQTAQDLIESHLRFL